MGNKSLTRNLYIFFAFVFAGVAAIGSYQVMANSGHGTKFTYVYEAKTYIPLRTQITPGQLVKIKFTLSSYPNAMSDPQGKVALVGIEPGEVILDNMVATGQAGGLSACVPEGMYAMSIPINQVTGVNGGIEQGDRVDILAPNANANSKFGISDVALNLLVLDRTDSTLTLELTQAQAMDIVQAESHGTLTVLLRGVGR